MSYVENGLEYSNAWYRKIIDADGKSSSQQLIRLINHGDDKTFDLVIDFTSPLGLGSSSTEIRSLSIYDLNSIIVGIQDIIKEAGSVVRHEGAD